MIYAEEKFENIYLEMLPLLYKHYEEIAHYQDIKLEVDDKKYIALTRMGVFRLFTARDPAANELLGYQGFMISNNIHYSSSVQAVEDVLYVHPQRRGFGAKFIRWVDDELARSGIQVVYRHVKKAHNHGPLLVRQNYTEIDHIYGKRLDK